jgi:DNA-directed RNA polymerase subunit L
MKPDKNIKNKYNQTALEIAVENEDETLINMLS